MSAANTSSHDEFDPATKGLRVPAKCDSCKHRVATNLGFVAPDEGTTVRLVGTEFVLTEQDIVDAVDRARNVALGTRARLDN